MFDVTIVKQELQGLVGFRQPANPTFAIVDTQNQLSESNLFVTDNPYAKIEYLKSNNDYAKISNVDFNTYIRNLKATSCINVCSQVFNEPDFIDRNQIYTNTNDKTDVQQLPIGFVGYRIDLDQKKNLALRINKAIFEFEDSGNVKLLVFNSNLKQPIYSQDITHGDYFHQEDVNCVINDLGFYKGSIYIGFISDGTKSAYKRNFENSSIRNNITYISTQSVLSENHSVEELFNQKELINMSDYLGMNLDLTIYDDFTDFIITNKYLFSRAIYLDCIISCLNIYIASLRSNMNERNSEELYTRIMIEIEGTRPDDNVIHVRGLRQEMLYEISQIREQLLKLKEGFLGVGYFIETQD